MWSSIQSMVSVMMANDSCALELMIVLYSCNLPLFSLFFLSNTESEFMPYTIAFKRLNIQAMGTVLVYKHIHPKSWQNQDPQKLFVSMGVE